MSAPHILVIDDEPDIRELVKEILEDEGYQVAVADSARTARVSKATQSPDLVLLDIWMPGEDGISLLKDWRDKHELLFPVVMMSGHGTVETAVEATRLGAFDFVEKPLSLAKLLMVVEKALATASNDPQFESAEATVDQLVGRSRYAESLRQQIDALAESDDNVLINGEAATGRSLIAAHIHQKSTRRARPLVTLRCDALEERTAAVELFGSEHGGVVTKGLFEQADGGTLHLAEITGLAPSVQTLLLGAIRARGYLRVGGSRPLNMDVRLIASTSVDMQHSVQTGDFDAGLQRNLKTVPLNTSGLREHTEDIPDLLEYYTDWFVANESLKYRHFDVAAQNRLRNHDWPGNLRELKNLVQRLLLTGGGVEVELHEIDTVLTEHQQETSDDTDTMVIPLGLSLREARAEFERSYLQLQLARSEGSMGELAKKVGMERTHLYRKLRSLGIDTGKQK